MLRNPPPIIKIYEALGAIADDRIELIKGLFVEAKVYSSNRSKYYTVTYDESNKSIMTNDNGSYWQWYLGYPGIAILLLTNTLPLEKTYSEYLKDIARKDINTQNKNNFDKTQKQIDTMIAEKYWNIEAFHKYIQNLNMLLQTNQFDYLGKKIRPPKEM